MSVYPQSLTKISEASIHKVNEDKGQNLKKWTGDSHYSAYGESYIVGLNIKDGETNGENTIIPAYDFIEKVADVVATDSTELENALKDSSVSTIFVSKDIALVNNVTITASKAILGIHAKLNLNSKTITINTFNLDVYCKVNGVCNIDGNGTIWFKDVLCADSSNPISAPNATKTYERFVNSSDYKTTYSYSGWRQVFKDNTFPWKDLQDALNAEATTRQNADNTLQANIDAEEAERIEEIGNEREARINEDNRLDSHITEVQEEIQAAIATEAQTRSSADADLRNALTDESNERISKDNEINLRITNEVDTLNTRITNEINKVYKPKGNATPAQIQTYTPNANRLGEVYNIIGITERTTINLTDSSGASYNVEVEPDEDVGCINIGTDNAPVYRWNDFGGKIDLSDYYTKSKVDEIAAKATTEVIQGHNIDLGTATAVDGHAKYTVNANVESISVNTDAGLSLSTGTTSAHVTPKTISLDLADANDIAECETLFDDV